MLKFYRIPSFILILATLFACSESPAASGIQEFKTNEITEITIAELSNDYLQSHLIIDVREPKEFALGHIENATLLPMGTIKTEFPTYLKSKFNAQSINALKDTPVLLYCGSGYRSAKSAEVLNQLGFTNVTSLAGGIKAWKEDKREVIIPK